MDTFTVTEEIQVQRVAGRHVRFASSRSSGRQNETPDGKPLPMMLEAHPGGRWYRDLGGDNGHLWAFVQSIKRPVLLEFWGPLFMSTGATSNMQYRLTEKDGGTRIDFRHTVVGPFPEEHRTPLVNRMEGDARAREARRRSHERRLRLEGHHENHRHCSLNSIRKPSPRPACSSACRRSTCRGDRTPSRCRSASWPCMSPPFPATSPSLPRWTRVPEPPRFTQPEAATPPELVPTLDGERGQGAPDPRWIRR